MLFRAFQLGLLFVSCLTVSCLANLATEYHHAAFLDPDEVYKLYWSVNNTDKSIHIAVEVKTTGWVGFGLSPGLTGGMTASDIVIGWVDSKGQGHLLDAHATGNAKPIVDKSQDCELIGASEDNGVTILKFKRKLITCDKDDRAIKTETVKVIFSYGDTDELKYHGNNRGARSLNLLDYVRNVPTPISAKSFDLVLKNVSVPSQRTTYWCQAFKLSNHVNLPTIKHIIEIAPIVEKKDRGIVHHMVLYACNDNFNENHLNSSGRCYDNRMPDSIKQCAGGSSIFAWAVGGVNFKFPDHVGLPIGASYSFKYVILETHFDNPSRTSNFVVSSGLKFFYDTPRKYEAGNLQTGTSSLSGLVIPPKQENWVVEGYCPKSCSEKLKDPNSPSDNEVKIFASFPHAHTVGHAIWTKLVRDGREITEFIRDDNYDFDFQQTRLLTEEVPFKAGDELFTYCRYNTMKRKFATVGGESTTDEMCYNFIMYYPRRNFSSCISEESQLQGSFSKKYAKPVEYTLRNQTVTVYRNWTDVAWNDSMVQQLKKAYDYDGPDAIRPRCYGSSANIYPLPSVRRPKITQSLPPAKDVCVKDGGTKGSAIKAGHGSVCFAIIVLSALALGLAK